MIRPHHLCIALAAIAALSAGGAAAQARDPDFPDSLASADVTAWMGRNTDLDPASVVAVTPSAVTGMLSVISTPEGPTIRQVNLRSETISRVAYLQDGVLSWTSVVEVDCKTRKARLGRTMAYDQRNLLGDGRQTVAASRAWIAPIVGGPAHNVMLRVCDGKTVNPLTGEGMRTAAGPRPKPAAPKPSAPATPSGRPAPAAKPPPAGPVAPGPVSVQVAAAGSDAAARRRLATVRKRQAPPAGVSARVVRAVVGGKTYFRAQFTGFQTGAAARDFCRAAAPDGCLVRGARDD